MDQERFKNLALSEDIEMQRPKDPSTRTIYWQNYEDLAGQLIFTGRINTDLFSRRGFRISLRKEMEPKNIDHAVQIGRMRGAYWTTEGIIAGVELELEKVIAFTPQEPGLQNTQ